MDIFFLETDTIDISGLDTLISFSRYQPHHQDNFLTGLLLDKDLLSHEGIRLNTQGTTLTPDRVARLKEIGDMNPSFDFEFKIKRGPELIAKFKQEIITILAKLLVVRSKYKVYSRFLGDIKEETDKTSMMANIITVSDIYLQTESGLFGVREKISHIIDGLNISVLRSKERM